MSGLAVIIGFALGVVVVLFGITDSDTGQIVSAFFNPKGAAIVLGGVIAATLINYPATRIYFNLLSLQKLFSRWRMGPIEAIPTLCHLSELSHQHGLLKLEQLADEYSYPFLRYALSQLTLHSNSEHLERNLRTELHQFESRQAHCQEMYHNMAVYAPAFGMLGTVMGLIIMMAGQAGESTAVITLSSEQASPMAGILHGMGLALVTTFYGVLLSNLVFLPLAGRLKGIAQEEQLVNDIIVQGILAIKRQDSPTRVSDELYAFVSQHVRRNLDQAKAD